ncbi:MAG TPA: serine/threonine-protein kinase [Gemmatimonadales bacterium]|nr:serine/threonine-protein kinase [Gemmatimonadales bacterium]
MDDPLLERLRRALAPEFEVDGRLAAGGMGIVFSAREVALDRHVAIKVLRPELATAVARERFLRESRLLARLQHPNIVPVHRADERDGIPFYVMDFIAGRTLADRLVDGPMAPDDLIRLGHDLLRGLAAAHALGIVHRDIKPQNIFFVGGRAMLGDFGIAREVHRHPQELTDEGAVLGTRAYMAPEQLRGEPADDRSDQYAGAAVLYQAATGRLWKVLDRPSGADWTGVPGAMAPVLQRALAIDPSERWPAMLDVRRAFDRGKHRPRRIRAGAGILIVLGIIGWLGWVAWRSTPLPSDRRALAVLPFAVVGAPDDPLGLQTAEITSINLSGFPGLSRVPFNRAAAWRRDHPDDDADAARRALGVDRVIFASIERTSGETVLRLEQTDSTGAILLGSIRLPGGNPSPGLLGDSAALRIGARLGMRSGAARASLSSRNIVAVGQFLRGEELFDQDAWHLAADHYRAAIAADPGFALARWRLLVARLWARESSWEDAAALVACCADKLPPLESGLARAMSDTNLSRRFAAFDSLERRYGLVDPLPLLFASDLFHRGPLVGRGLPASLEMFESAIHGHPGGTPAPAYDHLVWGKTRLGDREQADAWLRRRRRLPAEAAGEPPVTAFLQLGYDLRWSPWIARGKLWALERFGSEEDLKQLARYFRFSAAWDLPEGQDGVGRLIAWRLTGRDRASGLEAQALARFTWGRVSDGLALADSAAYLFQTDETEIQRHQWRLLLPLLGAGRADEQEMMSARRWMEARASDPRFAARARWSLALDATARGDSAIADGWIAGLRELAAASDEAGRLGVLAAAIRLGGGDPGGALAVSAPLPAWDSPAPGHDVFYRSLLHLSRARWFETLGRTEEAEQEILWYENSDTYRFPVLEAQKMEVDAVASAAARVARARLLLSLGDSAEACRLLTRVRRLWRDADRSLDAARAELEAVRKGGCR